LQINLEIKNLADLYIMSWQGGLCSVVAVFSIARVRNIPNVWNITLFIISRRNLHEPNKAVHPE
jgi:hypothetical protein